MAALIQYVNGVPAIKFPLDELSTCIGRALVSDICIDNKFVSKKHALIEVDESDGISSDRAFYIRDLNSTNHTYVNKTAVKHIRLKDRDRINIGNEVFVFEQDDSDSEIADVILFSEDQDQIDKHGLELNQGAEPGERFSRRLNLF